MSTAITRRCGLTDTARTDSPSPCLDRLIGLVESASLEASTVFPISPATCRCYRARRKCRYKPPSARMHRRARTADRSSMRMVTNRLHLVPGRTATESESYPWVNGDQTNDSARYRGGRDDGSASGRRHANSGGIAAWSDERRRTAIPCWSVHSPRFTRHNNESIDVAVVYGAAHMPAVTRQMSARFGYRPRTAEWLPVFDC
jgi:hypothetical protein